MQLINGTKMQGCMVAMIFMMPLFTAWIAYSVPGAVGFYWIVSNLLGFVQSLIMNKFFSPSIIEAKTEAQRVVLRREQEAKYEFLEAPEFDAQFENDNVEEVKDNKNKSGSKKNKNKKPSKNNDKSSYVGRKR